MSKDNRASYWSKYPPKIIMPDDPNLEDWRTVDLAILSPIEQRLVQQFRDRANELGIDLAVAPESATDMYKPPFTEENEDS